jgi:hypothetical protein
LRSFRLVALAAFAAGLAAPVVAAPASDEAWSKNPRGFELGILQQTNGPGDGWTAQVVLRACQAPTCFTRQAQLPFQANAQGVWEATFPLSPTCDLDILNLPRGDYDSNDWKVTARPKSAGGCASAPAGIAGAYKSEV